MHSYTYKTASTLFSLLALLSTRLGVAAKCTNPALSLPLPSKVVFQFPNPTWIENFAVRSNSKLLITLLTTPDLYAVDPFLPPSQTAKLIYNFAPKSGLTGIAELEHDIFYVAAGNFDLAALTSSPGSYSIWQVDMRGLSHRPAPRVSKVADIKSATFLNGMTALDKEDGTLLMADSALGVVFKLNIHTGVSEIVIDIPEMKPPPPPAFQFGINGVKVKDGYLYFTNTGVSKFYRIPIGKDGKATGAVELLASNLQVDDLSLDKRDTAWIAGNVMNVLSAVLSNGTVLEVLGALNQLTVAGATATNFGRTEKDRDTLYVVTSGALASPVNGTLTEGAKVVAVETEQVEDLCIDH